MFSQADLNQVAIKGHNADPSAITLAALVKNNQQRIRNHLESVDTRVVSGHLVLQLISLVGYAGDPTYTEIEWACRRKVTGIGNALRLSSAGEFGQVMNGKFIANQDELISLVAKPVDPDLSFRDYTPAVYRYHEYTNINWMLGNGKPRGISFIEINLVALLWQYVKAREHYKKANIPITSPVYADRHIITRMLPSYMDIAFLNIHRSVATDTPIEKEFCIGTIPTPDLQPLAIRNANGVRRSLLNGAPLPGVVLAHVPQFFSTREPSTAIDRVMFRDPGQTLQGSWHHQIVNWYWSLFAFRYDNPSMDKYKSNLRVDMDRFDDLRVLAKLPKAAYNHLRHSLLIPLMNAVEN